MDSQESISAPALFFPSLLSQSSLRLELGQHLTSPEPSCFCPCGYRLLCITVTHTFRWVLEIEAQVLSVLRLTSLVLFKDFELHGTCSHSK